MLKTVKDKWFHKPDKILLHNISGHSLHVAMLPFYMSNYIERCKNMSIAKLLKSQSFKTANTQRPCSLLTLSACLNSAAQCFLYQIGHGFAFKRYPY